MAHFSKLLILKNKKTSTNFEDHIAVLTVNGNQNAGIESLLSHHKIEDLN